MPRWRYINKIIIIIIIIMKFGLVKHNYEHERCIASDAKNEQYNNEIITAGDSLQYVKEIMMFVRQSKQIISVQFCKY